MEQFLLETPTTVKDDDVNVDDIVEDLEKLPHELCTRHTCSCLLDVRNDDQYTMEDLHNKLFPKTRRGKRINTILLPPRRNPATNVLLS